MHVTITCKICGKEFEGETFADDIRDDLEEHLENHTAADAAAVK